MTLETAPGGPGRPELLCVGSPAGASVHLFDPQAQQVLCAGLRADTARMGPGIARFERSGCTRCASSAAGNGYAVVVGLDGDRIALSGFRPYTAR